MTKQTKVLHALFASLRDNRRTMMIAYGLLFCLGNMCLYNQFLTVNIFIPVPLGNWDATDQQRLKFWWV